MSSFSHFLYEIGGIETMSDTISTYSQPAGGIAAISKYNPHLWSAEQLRAIFVARKNELADLQHTLRTTPPGTVGQHVLLVGARGMGKSTLMRRLALAVEDDPDLSIAWLPLRFPEEQYTVATLGQFWANVLDSLADALQHLGLPVSELDAAAERIAALPAAEQAAACMAAIDRCADERRQRLLLLVDNTDLLLHNIGRDAHWALRATLQSNPRLFWVGGSYQSLEADSNYHDAFLDFFRVITLRPLRLEEMVLALQALAETFGGSVAHQEMERQLAAQPERLPTLRQLSGGNPRTTVMLYEILANGQNGSVRSDLEALLDNMTPLYKARMDALADLPRKLFAHILEHWAPISLGELAAVSQVPNTSISPQLKRLELDGLIEKSSLHGTSRSGYQAAERFFNIWYLMRFSSRRQRSRLTWLVEFMRLWFSSDELSTLAQQRMEGGHAALRSNHDLEYDRALADALPDQAPERHALRWSLLKELKANRSQLAELFDLEGADADFKGADDYLRRLAELPARLRHSPHSATEEEQTLWVEAVLGSIKLSLAEKESMAKSAAGLSRSQYDELLKVFGEERRELEKRFGAVAVQAVRTAVLSQDFFPDMPDSHLAYEQIQARFADEREALLLVSEQFYNRHKDEWCYKAQMLAQAAWPQDAEIAFRCTWLLHEKLWRYEEAETAYRQAIALDEKYAYPWNGLGYLLHYNLGRYEEAEAAYRKAIALDEKNAYPWNSLGNLLADHLGRYEEAEAAYRQAIALDEKEAYPLANLARLLARLGRHAEAELFYRETVSQATKENQELILQAHLFLSNRQLAMDALQALATAAQGGDQRAFFRIKEQVWECHELGQGERLADWMAESEAAGFLAPFIQALYILADAKGKLRDLPLESQQMADEIVRLARLRQEKK
ncbi:MAG: tetratricopeptide repeat protein [Ilumatobacteraceae bacterium]|nr:tetratricopeptide repeat protein [Ilumatobacteraceae bacterium]